MENEWPRANNPRSTALRRPGISSVYEWMPKTRLFSSSLYKRSVQIDSATPPATE